MWTRYSCCSLWLVVAMATVVGAAEIALPVAEPIVEGVSSVSEFAPGQPFYAGVRWRLPEGWHLYWQNPGDSGMAPQIEWIVPSNVQVGAVLWPAPSRFKEGEYATFGYTGTVMLVAPIAVGDAWPSDRELELKIATRWLLCADTCVPGSTQLTVTLRCAPQPSPSTNAPAIYAILRRLPRSWPRIAASAKLSSTTAWIRVTGLSGLRPGYLYPREEGLWPAGYDLTWNGVGEEWHTVVPLGLRRPWPERIQAVLELPEQGAAVMIDIITIRDIFPNRKESSP